MDVLIWAWPAWLMIGFVLGTIDYYISTQGFDEDHGAGYSFWIIFAWPVFLVVLLLVMVIHYFDMRQPVPNIELFKTDDKMQRWMFVAIWQTHTTWRWKVRRVGGLYHFVPSFWQNGSTNDMWMAANAFGGEPHESLYYPKPR